MHLTSQVHLGLNHKSHDLADFLAFNSAKLKNSILYHIRQVLTYYQNIKSNKPIYPQQVDVVQKVNQAINQYNSYLKAKYSLPDDIDKLNKKLLSPLGLSNYWIDNKALLQFYAKDLAEYELLSAQSSQQVIDQVIKDFKSFKALIKLYAQKKLSHKPNIPFYLDKLSDRNIVYFSNQQIRIVKDYLVISWQSKRISDAYKKKDYLHTTKIELNANEIKRLLSSVQEETLSSQGKIVLKDNRHVKEFILSEQNKYYYLKQYNKLPDKLRVKIPSKIKELLTKNNISNKNLTELIKQIRLVPSQKNNPDAYTLEIIYQNNDYSLDNIKKESKENKVENKIFQALDGDDFTDNYMVDFDKAKTKLHSIINNNDIRVAGIDPGVKRLITLTNNQGLSPIIVKHQQMVSFNQWYNKTLAKHQEYIKKNYDVSTSKKLRKLNEIRNHKISNWFQQLSAQVVEYLFEHGFDLLVIGKNIGQKQNINIGKNNNQKFVQIPFTKLWNMIAYKAYQKGICVITTEESYTSKACFLTNDFIPKYNPLKENIPPHQFSGTRTKGLYVVKNHIHHTGRLKCINADVNGSYNIIRKLYQNIGLEFSCEKILLKLGKKPLRQKLNQIFQPIIIMEKVVKKIIHMPKRKINHHDLSLSSGTPGLG